jgi:hypothetical protein
MHNRDWVERRYVTRERLARVKAEVVAAAPGGELASADLRDAGVEYVVVDDSDRRAGTVEMIMQLTPERVMRDLEAGRGMVTYVSGDVGAFVDLVVREFGAPLYEAQMRAASDIRGQADNRSPYYMDEQQRIMVVRVFGATWTIRA